MASTQELRRKIKSVKGTQKLTQAMQLVSAAKMNRAMQRATQSRTYSSLAWSIIQALLTRVGRDQHPLLIERPAKTVGIIVITTNGGLAGALNALLLRKVVTLISERKAAGQTVRILSIGKKGTQFFGRAFPNELAADYQVPDTIASIADSEDVANTAITGFLKAEFDQVIVAFNEFKTILSQTPTIRTLLPVQPEESTDEVTSGDTVFEPSKARVLDVLLPRAVRTQLYQMLLEANASEHAARMIAMKNATENAGELVDDLTLTMNGVRQAKITQEISEISAGAEALRTR